MINKKEKLELEKLKEVVESMLIIMNGKINDEFKFKFAQLINKYSYLLFGRIRRTS